MILVALLLFTSCSSYTATGAYVGGEFGRVIGSAIGSVQGGRRGHDVGTVVGTISGVAVGAAIGAVVERAQKEKYETTKPVAQKERERPEAIRRYDDRVDNASQRETRDYRFDHIGGNDAIDDRITFDNEELSDVPSYSVEELSRRPKIEIRNAALFDEDRNGILTRGEECTVIFEIMNNTSATVYDIYPLVEDATGNNHVKVSPNLRVESIAPFQGVRYTATILADKKLKDGEIIIRVGVAQRQTVIESQTREFSVPTRKKID